MLLHLLFLLIFRFVQKFMDMIRLELCHIFQWEILQKFSHYLIAQIVVERVQIEVLLTLIVIHLLKLVILNVVLDQLHLPEHLGLFLLSFFNILLIILFLLLKLFINFLEQLLFVWMLRVFVLDNQINLVLNHAQILVIVLFVIEIALLFVEYT